MQEWRRVDVPAFCERLIGFSIPQDEIVLVVSYEGMHLIDLREPVTVKTDNDYWEYDLYDPDVGFATYAGREWKMIGLYPGEPILTTSVGEHLVLDTEKETISVTKHGDMLWRFDYENFSGDWAAATFSPDGTYIVLGCPYDFDFRVFKRKLAD